MDPQSHCAAGLAIPEQRIDLQIGDAMATVGARTLDPDRLLWRVSRNLDLAPSTMKLAALEASRGDLAGRIGAETRLSRVLESLGGRHDICFIDCSPAIGMLTFNALVAADEVVIPVETGFFSLQGAAKQVSTIKSLGKRLGLTPSYRLLPTMHDTESVLARELLDELRRRFPAKVIPQVIRYDQRLREASSFGQPVIEYAPESSGAADYTALAQWLVENRAAAGQRRAANDEDAVELEAEASAPISVDHTAQEHAGPVATLPDDSASPWTDQASHAIGIPA
jgi:chromosome partitioning protein